jgi:lysophospholipid acyltransferase
MAVWARVYFYPIIGTALCMAFFASPAKAMLSSRLKARMERPEIARTKSFHSEDQQVVWVPMDAERELQEIVAEVRAEIEKRRKEGLQVPDVRSLVREKLAAVSGGGDVVGRVKESLEEVKKEL